SRWAGRACRSWPWPPWRCGRCGCSPPSSCRSTAGTTASGRRAARPGPERGRRRIARTPEGYIFLSSVRAPGSRPPSPRSPVNQAPVPPRPSAGSEPGRLQKALERRLRQRTAALRALPHFLIIGAQKGGTTSLYEYLAAHPRVLPAYRGEEVHYFDHHFRWGEAWYRRHFPLRAALRRRRAVTGETSPAYLFHPFAPQRIAATLPEARLIVLLRNPTDRAVSHYWHMVRTKVETLPLAEALHREPERILDGLERMARDEHHYAPDYVAFSYQKRGLYADQLARYLKYFDRSQLLVLQSEAFFRNPQAGYDTVLRFIGLAPHPLPSFPPQNVGTYGEETPEGVRETLDAYFRPHNERLYDLLQLDAPWW